MEHGARQNTTALLRWVISVWGQSLTLSLTTNIIQGIDNLPPADRTESGCDTDVVPHLCCFSESGGRILS